MDVAHREKGLGLLDGGRKFGGRVGEGVGKGGIRRRK